MKNKTWIVIFLMATFFCNCIYAQDKKPDLKVITIEKPEYDGKTNTTIIKVIISNAGDVKSPPAKAKMYDLDISLSDAKKLGAAEDKWWIFEENTKRSADKYGNAENLTPYDYDKYWESVVNIPALVPGKRITLTFKSKTWVYDTNCEIEVILDLENKVAESDENNNKKQFFDGG